MLDAAARDGLRRELVAWLRCLRGVDTLTALGLVAEIGTDWSPDRGAVDELRRAGAVGALLRPAALPGIDRAGGGHVRRLLVEAAWHQRQRPRVCVERQPLRADRSVLPAGRDREPSPPAIICVRARVQLRPTVRAPR